MIRKFKFLLVSVFAFTIIILFVIQNCSLVQDKAARISELMNIYQDYGLFNGSILVAENGKVIFKKSFGFANMEWDICNKPNTKFALASVTKQFTAMLIMQLVEEGKVKLDGTITGYLPEYRKDTGDIITIHHLLTHTSGIPNYFAHPEFWDEHPDKHADLDDMVKRFCSEDLEFVPGSKFTYSNSGYYILGLIIEKVTGKNYEEVLQEKILKPLEMYNTGLDRSEIVLENRASGYIKLFNNEFQNRPPFYMQNSFSSGGMYSTVEDLYLWDQSLYTEKLLSENYKDLMFKSHVSGWDGSYAYGWHIENFIFNGMQDSIKTISHGGVGSGSSSSLIRMIDHKHTIILISNIARTNLNDISLNIKKILYDKPYSLPKKSIAETIAKTILDIGIDEAINQYYKLKNDDFDSYNFDEEELNNLGYYLIGLKKIEVAIEIFKLNVDVLPEAFNTYDSLGKAYMINGDKELAILNYEKSLELNPDNANAVEMLKKLKENKNKMRIIDTIHNNIQIIIK